MGTRAMPRDMIELYVGLIETVDTPGAYDACRRLLSTDEGECADRFMFDRHRRQYVFAHALLRLALSDVAPEVAPSDWSFAAGRYGRPFVAAPATPAAPHFSLSHTAGCVACVVSGHEAVGIDLETVAPRDSLLETAQDFFAPEEIAVLESLPTRDATERFFDYWTLKEAYLKARGIGLNLPLDRFAMQVAPGTIGVSFRPEIADDPKNWRFALSSPSSKHRLAIADGSGAAGGLPITRHPWPLRENA
jgi:4'-phosphopantetheinyl transferase